MKYTYALSFFLIFFLFSCQNDTPDDSYTKEIEQWRAERLASLTKTDGWTTLIGLYWLKEGSQTFGSAEDNDIIFPENAAQHFGTITRTGDSLSVQFEENIEVQVNGAIKKSSQIKSDADTEMTKMTWNSLLWYAIKRGDRYGIRLKDSLSEMRTALTAIPHYPVDEKWKIEADFIPANQGDVIKIENILGQISENPLEGILSFTYQNKIYSLSATDGGPEHYFVIIADETTGEDTYGGGRYMYVNRAGENGKTYLDFNKAYNPPCVFSPFATCPLPPEDNILPFAVLAGEQELEGH